MGNSLLAIKIFNADRHAFNVQPRPNRPANDLHLQIVMPAGQPQIERRFHRIGPKPALRIAEHFARFDANPKIRKVAAEMTGSRHIADDLVARADQDGVSLKSRKKNRNVLREMLAVAVEGNEVLSSALGNISERGQQRGPLPKIRRMANHRNVQRLKNLPQVGVGAAVINNHNISDLLTTAPSDIGDRRGVVINRNATPDLGHFRWTIN